MVADLVESLISVVLRTLIDVLVSVPHAIVKLCVDTTACVRTCVIVVVDAVVVRGCVIVRGTVSVVLRPGREKVVVVIWLITRVVVLVVAEGLEVVVM
jgi:hypothetical protein